MSLRAAYTMETLRATQPSPRPGSDARLPHQDLRLPRRSAIPLLGGHSLSSMEPNSPQISSSDASAAARRTPPIAVQIASLHRAAEVARFDWRAKQRQRAEQRREAQSASYQPLPLAAEEDNRSASRRTYSTTMDAYVSAARDLSSVANRPGNTSRAQPHSIIDDDDDIEDTLSDLFDGETSGDSDGSTDNEVIAATMRASQQRRRDSNERRAERARMAAARSPSNIAGTSARPLQSSPYPGSLRTELGSSSFLHGDDDIVESQVWDRMVEDLAIGAGIGAQSRAWMNSAGTSSGNIYNRGISGGIAASMLALSASIPRNATTAGGTAGSLDPQRQLPHPIWARRYPGAAGEWLRGELARRANAATQQEVAANAVREALVGPSSSVLPRRDNLERSSTWLSPTAQDVASRQRFSDGSVTGAGANSSARERSASRIGQPTQEWSTLRFPALDPSTRSAAAEEARRRVADGASRDAGPPATLRADDRTSTRLAVPVDASSSTTPHPMPILWPSIQGAQRRALNEAMRNDTSSTETVRQEAGNSSGQTASRTDASRVVALMAQQTRERNAAALAQASRSYLAGSGQSSQQQSRAVRGGIEYLRRLRVLDGIDRNTSESSLQSNPGRVIFAEPEEEPEAWQAMPWYKPPDLIELLRSSEALEDKEGLSPQSASRDLTFDPDGTNLDWYQMARARMASAVPYNDDPNGEREDEVANSSTESFGVRRRIVASGPSATQRLRNRSALVIAEPENASDRGTQSEVQTWQYGEGWTLVDARNPSSGSGQDNVAGDSSTTWYRGPAFSTSPAPLQEQRRANAPTRRSSDPRQTRRPQRLSSLTSESLISLGDDAERPSTTNHSHARTLPVYDAPQRRAEYWGGDSDSFRTVLRSRYNRPFARESTPSPELLQTTLPDDTHRTLPQRRSTSDYARISHIGARLEEEFRARQGELRVREERLRAEVARRRIELDELRRRQGRIGRIVERNRDVYGVQSPLPEAVRDAPLPPPLLRDRDSMVEPVAQRGERSSDELTPSEGIVVQTSVSIQQDDAHAAPPSSLVRRPALRDPAPVPRTLRRLEARRSMLAAPPSHDVSYRDPHVTPSSIATAPTMTQQPQREETVPRMFASATQDHSSAASSRIRTGSIVQARPHLDDVARLDAPSPQLRRSNSWSSPLRALDPRCDA